MKYIIVYQVVSTHDHDEPCAIRNARAINKPPQYPVGAVIFTCKTYKVAKGIRNDASNYRRIEKIALPDWLIESVN